MIARHRLPRFHAQHVVALSGRVYRIDVAYPDRRLAVEADGFRWHGDVARWQGDLMRRNALTSAGWATLHFTWRDLEHRPGEVADEIRRCLRSRGRVAR